MHSIHWLSGWGIPPETFRLAAERFFPDCEHEVFAPTEANLARLRAVEGRVGGYSLGAHLLLREGWRSPAPPLLLAPFRAFVMEARQGGRITRVELRVLERRLAKEPFKALDGFYKRAGIDLPRPVELPYALPDLQWGLTQLARLEPTPARSPVKANIGAKDALLDAVAVRNSLGSEIFPLNCGHDFIALLRETSHVWQL